MNEYTIYAPFEQYWNGVANFKRINPSMVKEALSAAYNRGLGLGEYLFELMSSNDDEARALMRLLEN